jgi:hypothetical protein
MEGMEEEQEEEEPEEEQEEEGKPINATFDLTLFFLFAESNILESEESEAESEAESEEGKPPKAKGKNSQLAVGYKDDLSFVVRGDMIGVFRSQPGGQRKLKFVTNIQGISSPNGKRTFAPKKVILVFFS